MTGKRSGRLQAACFDLDGTLVDSGPLHTEAERRALAVLGVPELAPDHPVTFGMGIMPGMQALADHYGFQSAQQVFDSYLPAWESAFHGGLRAMPGADELLRSMTERSIPLAIVTSGEAEYVDAVLDQFGWSQLFAHKVTLESVANLKPHPEPYLKGAELLGVDPEHCLGIEDSSSGVASLKAAGLRVVYVGERDSDVIPPGISLSSLKQLDASLLDRLFGA